MGEVFDAAAALPKAMIRKIRQLVRVAVVGRVEEYDPAAQTCRALPLVPEQDTADGVARDLPPVALPLVPVVHYGGSLRGITFGLDVGDPVVLLVRHRSHQEVDNGADPPIAPQNAARMALSEAVALPGYVPPSTGQPAAHYRSDGQPVFYLDAGEALHVAVSTAAIALARADLVQGRLDALMTAYNAHFHTGVTAGTGVTGTTTTWTGSNNVATARVKVDS